MTPALVCFAAWCVGLAAAEVLVPGQLLVGSLALVSAVAGVALAVTLRPAVSWR